MKEIVLLKVLLLFSIPLIAQHLNKAGHLVPSTENASTDTYKISYSTNGSEVELEGLKLKGNSVIKTPYGFITLSGNYENAPSTVRFYTNEGEIVLEKSFGQALNFVLSPAKTFCAFHDMEMIWVISVTDKKMTSYPGSSIFSVNDAGQLALYNDETSTINFQDVSIKIDEPVYRTLFFQEQPLFITMKNVLRLKNNLTEVVFTSEGRIFDADVFDDRLFISVKKELEEEFLFNSFSSNDLEIFNAEEETHYYLIPEVTRNKIQNAADKPDSLDNELIRDPLNYFQDTVYQPVGNSYDEIQEYSYGYPYLHPGVDLMGIYLQDVYAVKSGFVKAVLTTNAEYHWRIAIANENTAGYSQGYLYAHLEETTIPYVAGDFVNEGDVVGQLVNFPVDGFVHCHFARIGCEGATWNGDWWTFDNPLCYMTNFFDTIPPQFEKSISNDAFAFRDVNGSYLSPDNLYGNVQVISKVHDRVNADWKVEVNKLRYSLSPLSSPQLMLIDTLAYEYNFYNDNYFLGPYYTTVLNTIYSRDVICYSTANYDIREYYHIVTNSDGNDTIDMSDSEQLFYTLFYPDGSYIFRVTAFDPSENMSIDSMIIEIKNGIIGMHDPSLSSPLKIWPNPFTSAISLSIQSKGSDNMGLTISNALGKAVFTMPQDDISNNDYETLDLGFLENGIYFLDFTHDGKHFVEKIVKQ